MRGGHLVFCATFSQNSKCNWSVCAKMLKGAGNNPFVKFQIGELEVGTYYLYQLFWDDLHIIFPSWNTFFGVSISTENWVLLSYVFAWIQNLILDCGRPKGGHNSSTILFYRPLIYVLGEFMTLYHLQLIKYPWELYTIHSIRHESHDLIWVIRYLH